MKQVNHIYAHETENLAENSDFTPLVFVYSANPKFKIVVISATNLPNASFISPKLVQLANQVVKTFKLQPSQVIWIELNFSKNTTPYYNGFNLIHFDWQAEQATNPYRLPIYEDWYISWLKDNFSPIFLDDIDRKLH